MGQRDNSFNGQVAVNDVNGVLESELITITNGSGSGTIIFNYKTTPMTTSLVVLYPVMPTKGHVTDNVVGQSGPIQVLPVGPAQKLGYHGVPTGEFANGQVIPGNVYTVNLQLTDANEYVTLDNGSINVSVDPTTTTGLIIHVAPLPVPVVNGRGSFGIEYSEKYTEGVVAEFVNSNKNAPPLLMGTINIWPYPGGDGG